MLNGCLQMSALSFDLLTGPVKCIKPNRMHCSTAYLNHIYDPCARSRKNMRKSAEHNLNQEHKKILCEKIILVFLVIELVPLQTLCKVIHQCKKQKHTCINQF